MTPEPPKPADPGKSGASSPKAQRRFLIPIRLDGLGDMKRYPKLHFLLDFLQILLLIGIVVFSVRAFEWAVWWTDTRLPGHAVPTEFQSYLPLVHTRWIVTVLEAVSDILITVVAIYTVVKVVGNLLGKKQ